MTIVTDVIEALRFGGAGITPGSNSNSAMIAAWPAAETGSAALTCI